MLLRTAHALTLFPLAWMVMASFMQAREASGYPLRYGSRASLNTGRRSHGSTSRDDTALMMAVGLDRAPVFVHYAALQG